MRIVSAAVKGLSRFMHWISCICLTAIIVVTVIDIVMRRVGAPVHFAMEITVFLAGIVIASALPQTTLDNGNVVMEFLTVQLTLRSRRVLFRITRCVGSIMIGIIGWKIIAVGMRLAKAGQISTNLKIPESPVAYIIAACFFVECLVLLCQLFDSPEEAQS